MVNVSCGDIDGFKKPSHKVKEVFCHFKKLFVLGNLIYGMLVLAHAIERAGTSLL